MPYATELMCEGPHPSPDSEKPTDSWKRGPQSQTNSTILRELY